MIRFSRRDVMTAGAAALAAPAVLRAHDALASSGTLNVYAWKGFFDQNTLLADFTNATGVNVQLTTYTSNGEAESQAARGRRQGLRPHLPLGRHRPELLQGRAAAADRRSQAEGGADHPLDLPQLAQARRGVSRPPLPRAVRLGHRGPHLGSDQVRHQVGRDLLWRPLARRPSEADRDPPVLRLHRRRALSRRHRRTALRPGAGHVQVGGGCAPRVRRLPEVHPRPQGQHRRHSGTTRRKRPPPS